MTAHLPILQVIIPLMAAPICLMFKRVQLVWFFSLIALSGCSHRPLAAVVAAAEVSATFVVAGVATA